MFQLVFASCLLASLAAAPADEPKTPPAVPNAYTVTIVATEPPGSPDALAERNIKVTYDGEEGILKRELEGNSDGKDVVSATYFFKNYQGRGAEFFVEKTGDCYVYYRESVLADDEVKNPFELPATAQFILAYDDDGEKVEQWQITGETQHINAYFKVKEGAPAIPVRYDVFGSVTGLPLVIKIKNFSATKPDPSVFEIDASKCKEKKNPISFFSGINQI